MWDESTADSHYRFIQALLSFLVKKSCVQPCSKPPKYLLNFFIREHFISQTQLLCKQNYISSYSIKTWSGHKLRSVYNELRLIFLWSRLHHVQLFWNFADQYFNSDSARRCHWMPKIHCLRRASVCINMNKKTELRRISSPRTKLLAASCECMHEHFHPITMLNSQF
jgi:hypothetical protein